MPCGILDNFPGKDFVLFHEKNPDVQFPQSAAEMW